MKRIVRSSSNSIKLIKARKFKIKLKESFDSTADTILILRVFPLRVKQGMRYFKDDFLTQLDSQQDQKHKTLFGIKVIGALTSFAISTFYQIKRGTNDLALPGLKHKNNLTHFIVAELAFKLTNLLVKRFLQELEQHLTNEEDLRHISYFRQLLVSKEDIELSDDSQVTEDPAIEIVEAFQYFIMTGKRFD
jgi:hypothetical protein